MRISYQPFCLKHRFETDHDCPAKKSGAQNAAANAAAAKDAAVAAARARRAQQEQQAQQQRLQQQQARPSSAASSARGAQDSLSQAAAGAWSVATTSPFSPFQGLQGQGNTRQAAQHGGGGTGAAQGSGGGGGGGEGRKKTKHSNKPDAAVGAQGIPESERMVLSVYFPVSSNRPPEYHVLSVRWSVGKVIDTLSTRGNVRNNNNQPGATRLVRKLLHIRCRFFFSILLFQFQFLPLIFSRVFNFLWNEKYPPRCASCVSSCSSFLSMQNM